MSATTEPEPTLFDPRPSEPEATRQTNQADVATDEPAEESQQAQEAQEAEAAAEGDKPGLDRKRLAEQLGALKRKEAELRRALAVADHPELADAIRLVEASAFCVTRAETKIAQGFSKSEARRREVIEKKLSALRDKRTELDTQLAALESELAGLGTQRMAEFEAERKNALKDLMITLATHDAALSAAGLDAHSLVPEIADWMPELESVAREVSGAASASN